MVGEALDFIRRRAQEFLAAQNSLFTNQTQNPQIDTVTFINQERTQGRLSNGQIVNTTAVGRPHETDIGYLQPDGSYLVQRDPVHKINSSQPGDTPWFIMGAYPLDPTGPIGTLPFVKSFPEFSLVNGKTLAKYWIDPASLPSLYELDNSLIFGNGGPRDGLWQAQISPDFKYIVILRLAEHVTLLPDESGTEYFVSSAHDETKAYWAVISNFTLDSINHKVVMTPGTVIINQGSRQFTEAIPDRDIPVTPSGNPFLDNFFNFFRFNKGTGNISFSPSSPPQIDLVGSWNNNSNKQLSSLPPITYFNKGGVWYVTDLTGAATEVHGPVLSTNILNENAYTAGDLINFNGPGTVTRSFLDSRTNRTGSGPGTDYVSFRKGVKTSSFGTVGFAPGIVRYFNPSYTNQAASYQLTDDVFLTDDTRTYPTFNLITGWQLGTGFVFTDNTHRIKTLDTGRFLELVTPDVDSKFVFQKWSYEPSNDIVIKGVKKTTQSIGNTFSIFTSAGEMTNWRILDWVLK